MKVDEEVKGAAAEKDLDVGGYEDDSEDEREIKEQEEGAKDVIFRLTGDAGAATTLVVCSGKVSQCLAKIMLGATWTEIGEATTMKTSTTDETNASDKGPKTIMNLYSFAGASPILVALPDLEKMKSDAANLVVSQLFG